MQTKTGSTSLFVDEIQAAYGGVGIDYFQEVNFATERDKKDPDMHITILDAESDTSYLFSPTPQDWFESTERDINDIELIDLTFGCS